MNAVVDVERVKAVAAEKFMPRVKKLRDVLSGLVSADVVARVPDAEITDITLDSRFVTPGAAFVGMPGLRTHGALHAAAALAKGAAVVLWEPSPLIDASALSHPRAIPIVNLSRSLGAIADAFFDQPSRALNIAAVTGTNGKTTTAYLIAQACELLGRAAGYSGTLGQGRPQALQSATHTTPDVISVHRQLAQLHDAGAADVGMEVSSHALHQGRVDAVRFDTAVFTNLTRDHLDYHGTLEAYGDAKALLFTWPGIRHRVINVTHEFGRALANAQQDKSTLTVYGAGAEQFARLRGCRYIVALNQTHGARGLELSIESSWGSNTLRSQLIGDFNADNLLAVLAVLLGWDVPMNRAVQALEGVVAPPGRMQTFTRDGRALIVIDYAHTPDALEKALQATRAHCRGQLVCVFGCGGDRDAGKRPLMGAIAERAADRVIVTDDNPRGEDPEHIVRGILGGMTNPNAVVVEHDRARAIEMAVRMTTSGDAVLVAGKGHEDYQIVAQETRHFSDREVVESVLETLS